MAYILAQKRMHTEMSVRVLTYLPSSFWVLLLKWYWFIFIHMHTHTPACLCACTLALRGLQLPPCTCATPLTYEQLHNAYTPDVFVLRYIHAYMHSHPHLTHMYRRSCSRCWQLPASTCSTSLRHRWWCLSALRCRTSLPSEITCTSAARFTAR
jgi:hypothetical protein